MKPITNQMRALEVANLAYLKDKSDDEIIGINAKNEKACMIFHDDHVEIGIAGSNDKIDWMHNLRFIGTKVNYLGRVHRGFSVNSQSLLDVILYNLIGHKEKKIYFRMHSRGGPIGCLIAKELCLMGYDVKSVIGWGIPNFLKEYGKEKFEQLGIEEVIFYRNGSDPVSNLLSWFYTKPVKDVEFGKKRKWYSFRKITDHYIANYIKNFFRDEIDYSKT